MKDETTGKIDKPKKLPQYKRVGRCQPKKCGAFCCRQAMGVMQTGHDSKRNKGWRSRHGDFYSFFGFIKYQISKNKKLYVPPMPCRYLKLKGGCAIQKTKPRVCKEFPEARDLDYYRMAKKAGCTYRFERRI